eukprot:COSAG02_NODE_164_length_32230_cov_37.505587_4_plen_173_part_00
MVCHACVCAYCSHCEMNQPCLRVCLLLLRSRCAGPCGRALITLNFASGLHLDRRDKLSADQREHVEEMLARLDRATRRTAFEELVLSMWCGQDVARASAPTGCAWQLRALKGWKIWCAFVYTEFRRYAAHPPSYLVLEKFLILCVYGLLAVLVFACQSRLAGKQVHADLFWR